MIDLAISLMHAVAVGITETSDLIGKAKAVLQIEISQLQLLADRIDEHFAEAVTALHDTLDRQNKIVVIGVGKSESIGKKLVATLNSTGATAVSLSCQNALHGDLGILSTNDLIIALSYSGETPEMTALLPHVKKRAATIIAITGNIESTLSKHSDIVLSTEVEQEACPLGLAPTSSSTNMLALGDALAMVLLEKRGFKSEDFAELHPGGNLGKYLLTKVSDIMRHDADLAVVLPETTVQETVLAMLKSRSGAAVVADQNKKLLGIFTHGDFVRGYQENRAIGDDLVQNRMSKDPVSIQYDELAVNVVKIIRDNRIDDVIVTDGKQKVVGLVDVQDLSNFDFA